MSDSWWTSWTSAHQALLFFTTSRSLLKSHPLSQWCYLTISSSAAPFSFCLQSFLASRSFPVGWFSCKATQTQDSVSQVPGHRWRKLSGKGYQLMLVEASYVWSLPRAAGSLVAPTSDQWWPHLQSLQTPPLPTPTPLILKKVQTTLNITGQKLSSHHWIPKPTWCFLCKWMKVYYNPTELTITWSASSWKINSLLFTYRL